MGPDVSFCTKVSMLAIGMDETMMSNCVLYLCGCVDGAL